MKGLLCNQTVVNNILAGTQSQDRRPMKVQPDTTHWKPEYINKPKEWRPMIRLGPVHHGYDPDIWCLYDVGDKASAVPYTGRKAPSKVGDILYLPESYQISGYNVMRDPKNSFTGHYLSDGVKFAVTPTAKDLKLWVARKKPYMKTSSMFMYKCLARYFVEVTEVRCERVQDISLEDIRAEGLGFAPDCDGSIMRTEWKNLWNTLYPGSWDLNDWVWVRTFKQITIENKSE